MKTARVVYQVGIEGTFCDLLCYEQNRFYFWVVQDSASGTVRSGWGMREIPKEAFRSKGEVVKYTIGIAEGIAEARKLFKGDIYLIGY